MLDGIFTDVALIDFRIPLERLFNAGFGEMLGLNLGLTI